MLLEKDFTRTISAKPSGMFSSSLLAGTTGLTLVFAGVRPVKHEDRNAP